MPLIVDTPCDTANVSPKTLKSTKTADAPEAPVETTSVTENTTDVPQYEPLKLSGILDQYEKYKVTPSFGTEFRNVNLKDWITGPDSDEHIRDLGILISRRGVVSFRGQTDMTDELQLDLCTRLGKLTGAPEGHTLYEHPMNGVRGDHRNLQTLNLKVQNDTHFKDGPPIKQSAVSEWHSDVPGEPCPASYTMLRMTHVNECGNDTMFADGYALYERLSHPYRRFAESLKQWCFIKGLNKAMIDNKDNPKLNVGPRGAPGNVGFLEPVLHPVVRTNPVTGWKSLYYAGLFFDSIDGFTEIETKEWNEKISNLLTRNHDIQYRHRWNTPGDMAIWDNRSTAHAATVDYDLDPRTFGPRLGKRCLFTGEKPFYDPKSISRYEEIKNGFA